MLTGDSSLSKVRELRKLKVFQTFYFEGEDTIHTWVDIETKINQYKSQGWGGFRFYLPGPGTFPDISLYKHRLETDKEYEIRIKQEESMKKYEERNRLRKEQRERKQYEELKKKFEPN